LPRFQRWHRHVIAYRRYARRPFNIGALVQTNYGDRHTLRVDGVPVGREIGPAVVPLPWQQPPVGSSIIVVVATDAPLISSQCSRLARRATVGLSRAGGIGMNTSGDIFLAFSTGNHYPRTADAPLPLRMLPHGHLNPLFEAVAEAVEESILNALVAAETMVGYAGRTAYALPLDMLRQIMVRYGRATR
jgi:D-aminopeptidase